MNKVPAGLREQVDWTSVLCMTSEVECCLTLVKLATGRVHTFRVAIAVCLGVATVMLMDATNTFYFAWFRWELCH